jgi:soluble lytic murein transglycosylase-like protein
MKRLLFLVMAILSLLAICENAIAAPKNQANLVSSKYFTQADLLQAPQWAKEYFERKETAGEKVKFSKSGNSLVVSKKQTDSKYFTKAELAQAQLWAKEYFEDKKKRNTDKAADYMASCYDEFSGKGNIRYSAGVRQWFPLIEKIAKKHNMDPENLKKLVRVESGGDPNAVSPKGAMGLGQLMPGTAAGLGVKNPFDPEENLDGAARYLEQMRRMFGSEELAFMAYYIGPGNLKKKRLMKDGNIYVAKIQGTWKKSSQTSFAKK